MKNKDHALPVDAKNQTVQTSAQSPVDFFLHILDVAGIEHQDESLLSDDQLGEQILKSRQKSALYDALAGRYLTVGQERSGHGFITQEAKRLNVSKRSLYNYIDVYQTFLRFPQESVKLLHTLNSAKVLFLKNFDDEELSELVSGEQVKGITFDDIQIFPKQEMERRFKKAELSNNELQQQIDKERAEKEHAQHENRLLKRQKNELTGFIYPEVIERVRIESSVLASQVNQCLDDLEQLMVELNASEDLAGDDLNKSDAEFSAGASTLYVNLNSIYSKASYLLSNFRHKVGGAYIPEQPEDTPLLTEEEAQRVHNMREVMLAEHDIAKQTRQNARDSKRRNKQA